MPGRTATPRRATAATRGAPGRRCPVTVAGGRRRPGSTARDAAPRHTPHVARAGRRTGWPGVGLDDQWWRWSLPARVRRCGRGHRARPAGGARAGRVALRRRARAHRGPSAGVRVVRGGQRGRRDRRGARPAAGMPLDALPAPTCPRGRRRDRRRPGGGRPVRGGPRARGRRRPGCRAVELAVIAEAYRLVGRRSRAPRRSSVP